LLDNASFWFWCFVQGGDVPPRAIVGRQYSGCPSHVSPLFSYKYRGDKENKRGDGKRTSEGTEESKRREKKKRGKEKNIKGKELKTERKKRTEQEREQKRERTREKRTKRKK
jgi:hypothetical protein